jgi:CubicO group peptidase (beta-lactamase class C family)
VDSLPSDIQAAAERRLRERGVNGVAVCAFGADGILMAGGVGVADVSRDEPVTAGTIFRVASVSKLLTATLMFSLAESGSVDLARPFNEYLPPELRITDRTGSPAASPLATLLSHSSGLAGGIRGAEVPKNPVVSYVANGGRVADLAAAVRGIRMSYDEGTKVVYSNPGYNVAGLVAALTTGQPFERVVQERVLGPLGMDCSEFVPHRSGPGIATHYGRTVPPSVGPRPAAGPRLVATPMGGLTSSVLELARFGRMMLNGGTLDGRRILSPESVAAMTSMVARNHPDLEQGYGQGFRVGNWRGRRVAGHDGNMPGVASRLVIAPDDGVGVVVLTNGFSLAVPHEVAEVTLARVLGLPPEEPAPALPEGAVRAEWRSLAERVAGTYKLVDAAAPGVVGRLNDATTSVRVMADVGGRLRLEGNPSSDGPAWLMPEGRVGHYRVAAAVEHTNDAVVEERADGTHIWLGHLTHLHRRRPRRSRG